AGKQTAFMRHGDMVTDVAFSPRGRSLASASQDRLVRVLDPATAAQRAVLRGHTDAVTSVAYAPDGRTLATGSRDRTVKLWRAVRPPLLARASVQDQGGTWFALISPDGKTLATGGDDRLLHLRAIDLSRRPAPLQAPSGVIYGAAFAPDGKTLAT